MDEVEAGKQIAQMCNFILNEAKESADNINAKANEDFNTEKLKLVQSLKGKVRGDMEKKKKAQETQVAIERSTAINRARLRKIEARQQCIEKLNADVATSLKSVANSDNRYKQIIVDLIVQGCVKLMEEDVTVRCRAADASAVKGLLDQASQAYTKVVQNATKVKKYVKLSIDAKQLPATGLGGVVVCCQGGSIIVDNTLDTRLKLVMENDRPALRHMLFPGA